MKAMKLTGIRKIEMMEVPDPQIKSDNDVKVKMKSVGICGSDVHYYTTGKIGSQVVEYPFTVGHEGAGEIIEIGKNVKNLKVGDRVAIEPATHCGVCDQCLSGRFNTCRELTFLGCPKQVEGCLSEYIVLKEQNCFPTKDSMSYDQAAISEPLAIGVYCVKQSVPMEGAKIGIFGSGPIGFSCLLPAIAQGAEKIYVTDKIDSRLEHAKKHGAYWTGNPDKTDIVKEINAVEKLGLDAVIECCGQQEAIDQAIKVLKPGGKLVLVGIPEVDRISFQIDLFRRKEISLQNIRRQEGCVQDALDMIDNKDFSVDFMATHELPFEKTKEGMDMVAEYADGVIKAMIHFD